MGGETRWYRTHEVGGCALFLPGGEGTAWMLSRDLSFFKREVRRGGGGCAGTRVQRGTPPAWARERTLMEVLGVTAGSCAPTRPLVEWRGGTGCARPKHWRARRQRHAAARASLRAGKSRRQPLWRGLEGTQRCGGVGDGGAVRNGGRGQARGWLAWRGGEDVAGGRDPDATSGAALVGARQQRNRRRGVPGCGGPSPCLRGRPPTLFRRLNGGGPAGVCGGGRE